MQLTRLGALRLAIPNDSLEPRRDLNLEGLRGLCALFVVYGHLSFPAPLLDPKYSLKTLSIDFGPPSVLIFFVLSGYVIGLTVRTPPTLKEVWHYLQRRALRIIPIAWVAVVISSLVERDPFKVIAGNLLFLQNVLPYSFGVRFPLLSGDPSLWSLSYEMLYYIAFLVIWRFAPRAWIVYGVTIVLLIAQPIGVPAIIASQAAGFLFWLSGLTIAWTMPSEPGVPNTRWLAAVVGALAYWTIGPLRTFTFLFLHRYPTASTVSLGNVDFCLAATLIVLAVSNRGRKLQDALATFAFLLCLLVIPLKMIEVMMTDGDRWAMGFLALALFLWTWQPKSPPLSYMAPIGAISYALYAIHLPIAYGIRDRCLFLPSGSAWSYSIRLCIFATIAFPSAWFLERRFQRWIKMILNRPLGESTK